MPRAHRSGRSCHIGSLLGDAGWSPDVIRDVTTDYTRWYKNFAARIHELRPKLVQECGIETWEYASNFYDTIHETLQTGGMGGAIVYALRQVRRTKRKRMRDNIR